MNTTEKFTNQLSCSRPTSTLQFKNNVMGNFKHTIYRKIVIGLLSISTIFAISKTDAQNTLDKLGLTGSYQSPAAFSLRLLSSSYFGKAIQVRRSSDNTTQDIGFTTNGDLDTASLKTFVGSGGNGFVTIWYDQSSNARNATQSTTSLQPQIVNGGVVYRKNNSPTIYFNNTYLGTAAFTGYPSAFSLAICAGVNSNTSYPTFGNKTNNNIGAPWDIYGDNFYIGNGSNTGAYSPTTGLTSSTGFAEWVFTSNTSTASAYLNGNNNGSSSIGNYQDIGNPLYIASRNDHVTQLNGWISEFITLNSVLSATDRGTVQTNQSNYFINTTVAPTIGSFSVPSQTNGASPFTLTAPTSNSSGAWSYASSNTSVATISGSTVTVVGAGTSTITATQAANGSYTSGSTTATLTVNPQAPGSFSYTTPNTYTVGTAITALSPTLGAGTVTTVGSGFNGCGGVAIDAAGNIYVADAGNNALKKVATDGTITTIATGTYYIAVAVDPAGNVYATTLSAGTVVKFTHNSDGTYASGTTYASGFGSYPDGLCIDASGNLYVASYQNNQVYKIATNGTVTTIGSGYSGPTGVYADANGNVYVANLGNASIYKVTASNSVSTVATVSQPYDMVFDGLGNLYVTSWTGIAEEIAPNGTVINTWTGLSYPSQIIADAANNIYIGDRGNNVIKKIGSNGGSASSYSISPALSAGLNFSTSTGVISGTPTAASASTSYTVTASNVSGSATSAISILVNKGTPSITTAPTASSITYGQTLASSILGGGVASVAGTFTFTTPSTSPSVGTASQGYTFTPTDATNYNTVTGTVSVTVGAAIPTITITIGTYTYNGAAQGPASATNTGTGTSYTFSYAGTANDGTTYSSTTPPTKAGSYTVTATVSANGNYTSASSSATAFTIGQATLTIRAANQSVCYGTAASAVTSAGSYTVSGYIGSDNSSVISGIATYTTTYTNTTAGGTAGITITPLVTGLSASNYTFAAAAGTVTVNALPTPTVSASGATTICSGGSVTLSAGGAGDAINFNGSSKYISVQNHANLPIGNSNYTLEAWIKPSQSSNGGILGWGNWGGTNQVNAFRLNGSGQLDNYWWGNDLLVNTPNLADGSWHHVAATYDGTTRSIYVDGVLKGYDNPSGHNVPNANNIQIATTNVGEYFYGGIDEVRIWNVARTQSQIQSAMNSTVPANSTGLAAYYKFDEGTGTTTADATGNGNNGTLVNTPSWIIPSTAPLVSYSSYLWSTGETTSSINVSTAGNYSVYVTNANSCSATSATTSVTVNSLPTATITASGATTFCAGGSVTLTASAGSSYSWNNGATTQSINVTTTGSYTVTVTNASGCSATSTATSVTVNALPTATITAGGSTTFCSGGSVTLTASAGTSYAWSNGATTSSISPTTAGSYSVTVTNSNGCSATSAATTVTVNALPTVTISPNTTAATTICNGSSVMLTASGASSYIWNGGVTSATPLDNVSSSAALAVGLRKLKSSYNGYAVRIRRSTDNAQQDFGFSGNDLDVASISSFLGSATGYITTLYDQSGNGRNLTQANTGSQPTIVLNGINGKPVISELASPQQKIANATNFSAPVTVIYGGKQNGLQARGRLLTCNSGNWLMGWYSNGTRAAYFEGWVVAPNSTPTNSPLVYTGTIPGAGQASTLYENGTSVGSGTGGTTGPNGISMGAGGTYSNEVADAYFTDLFIYSSVLSTTDRQTLENSTGGYYGIFSNYPTTAAITAAPQTTTTYTVTGTNAAGCSATASQTVTVNALPTATITSNTTSTCPGNTIVLSANTGTGLSYQWLKGGASISGATSSTYGATASGVYSVVVTNSNNCSVTSNAITTTIQDVTPPTVVAKAITVNLDATGNATITPSQVDNGSTDNCGIASMTLSKTNFSCSDINLNSSALTFNAGADGVTTNATASNLPYGNSARTISLWVNQSQTNNTIGGIVHYGTGDCTGLMCGIGMSGSNPTFWGGCRDHVSSTLTVANNQWTYIALTYDGNSNYVMYKDNVAESFTLSGGLNTQVSKLFIGHETTNNGGNYRNEFTGSIDEVKIYNRALSASEIAADRLGTNQSGLVSYFPFSEGSGTTINDAIGGNTATLLNPTGSNWITRNSGSGPATTTLTVTDVNGNSASASATVTVVDNIAPVITCPSNISTSCGANKCGATVSITNPTATDNCSVAGIVGTRSDGLALTADYPKGTTTITWTATDASGNTATCNQIVTVVDNTPPTITAPANISLIATSAAGAVATYTAPVGTDNCSGATTTRTAGLASGSTFPIGVNTVTYTATDGSGNTSSCSFTVTVLGVAPTITCPSNITVNNATGVCGANVTFGTPTTTGYPAPTVTYSIASGSFFSVGTTTVTITATNAVGTATCNFNVTVLDVTPPSITAPANIVVPATSLSGAVVTYTTPVGTDNCSGVTTTRTAGLASGSTFALGTTIVSYLTTDASGNTASCSFTVTVNPLPIASISGTTAVCNNSTAPVITFTGSNATAPYTFTYTLNGVTNTVTTTSGNSVTVAAPTSTVGNYVYSLVSIQDASSTLTTNTASGTATVTVNALPTPTITGQTYGCGNISYTANRGVSYLWNTGSTPAAATNTFTTASSYIAKVVATDANGCKASASQVIPANTAPTITSVAAQNTLVETTVAPTVTVGDLETPNNLTVTGTSSNTKLVPNANIVVTGSGATRTITVTPAQDQIGTATITVTVTDCGGLSTSTTFNVTVTVPNYPSGTAGFVIRKTVSLIDNCSDSIYFVNRSYNGPGAIYQWYINGYYTTMSSFLNSPNGLIGYKNAFPGTYTALLVITDPVNGKTYQTSQTFTFTRGIVPVPSPSFIVHSVVPNGSGTASVTLNSLTPSVQDGLINAWTVTPMTNVAAFDATPSTPTLSITQTTSPQTFNATLTVTPTNGCKSYTTAAQTITVPEYSPIVANFTAGVTKSKVDPCSDSVYFINTTTGGVGGNTYTWFLGDNSPAIVTASTATIGKLYVHPNTYSILLNVKDATGQTASKQVNVTTNGTIPPVTAVAEIYGPNNTTNTATVTLEAGNSYTAFGSLNYNWTVTPAGGAATIYNNVNQQLTISRAATSQTYTAKLTVRDALTGCKSSIATQTFTIDKLEPIPPTATPIAANFTVGVTKSKVNPCNDSVYIVNTTTGGSGGNTYTWYLGDNSTPIVTTSTATIGKIYTYPNTYNIVMDVADHAGQYTSKQMTVTTNGTTPAVTAVPIVYGPYNSTATSSVLLEGGNSTIAYGTLNYAWTITPVVGSVSSSTSVNVPLTITRTTADQTYTAVLTVSDALGCKTNSATKTFTVSKLDPVVPAPTPIIANFAINVTKSKVDPCVDSVYFTNTTTGGAGGLVYTWYLGDNTSSPYVTTSTATFGKIYIHPNTYTVHLVVNDNAGQYSSKQLTVTTVGTTPPVYAVPIVYGPYYTTNAATVTLDGGNSNTAYGGLNYAWTVTPAGGTAASYTTPSVPLTISRTSNDVVYTAQLTVTDALTGCKTSTVTKTFTISKLVTVPPPPAPLTANFTVNVTKSLVDPCSDSVYITNTTSGGAGNNKYVWYLGDGASINTTNTTTIGHIYTYAGTYNIQLDVSDKAGTYASKIISVTTIGTTPTVNAVPIIYGPYNSPTSSTVTFDGGNSTISSGSGLLYSWVISSGGAPVLSFNSAKNTWTVNRTSVDQVYTAVLTVTDATGCRKSVGNPITFTIPKLVPGTRLISAASTIQETKDAVVVYPNPARNNVSVKISLRESTGKVTIRLYNAMGKQVIESKQAVGNSKEMTANMSLPNIAPGMYYVKVFNEAGVLVGSSNVVKE